MFAHAHILWSYYKTSIIILYIPRVPRENISFSDCLALELQHPCCIRTFTVNINVLNQLNLIIILFWQSYTANKEAISFLIKTNCSSLTATEFLLQPFDKNKHIITFSLGILFLPIFHFYVSECVFLFVCMFAFQKARKIMVEVVQFNRWMPFILCKIFVRASLH